MARQTTSGRCARALQSRGFRGSQAMGHGTHVVEQQQHLGSFLADRSLVDTGWWSQSCSFQRTPSMLQ